ncbi:phage tail assembly chaperone [Sphingomonas quercus]|uniref:Phage tail assembly chaperone n=1 Tax=Sphingomonas quercus TaxID=2842451 RepID=A0ABS6BJI9_9SPHN|nr:phage tail assembly chaperone [Sphingomonas quercus]MBU3078466.1 phage tail assembly chaperone [Sphingomonas quercus]
MSGFTNAAARLAGLAGALAGWRPDEFWRATPAELAAVIAAIAGGEGAAPPANTSDLARLQEMFPDG